MTAYWTLLGAVGVGIVGLAVVAVIRSLCDPIGDAVIASRIRASARRRLEHIDRWVDELRSQAETSTWELACAEAAGSGAWSVANTHTPRHDRLSLNHAAALELTGGIPPAPAGTVPVRVLPIAEQAWRAAESTRELPAIYLLT